MTKQLTPSQANAMLTLSQYVGQTVQVLTSEYDANIAKAARDASVGTFKSAALRGLVSKGFIEMNAYWKGATVTVLKAA